MSKLTDIRLLSAESSNETIGYRAPIKFGGRVVTDVVILDVVVDVETRDGRRGRGFGSMPMGNAWAWPSGRVADADALAAMVALGERLVIDAGAYRDYGDPLEITHALAAGQATAAGEITGQAGLAEPMPRLAQLVAASPLEAAIHDAFGHALGQNSYNLLGSEFINADLGHYLGADFAGEFLDRYTLRQPKPRMPLYHLVGALDPLTAADVTRPIADGLPETLGEWILADGLTHLKIKLAGDNLAWDVERVVSVERAAAEAQARRGCQAWNYSLDFNEKCASEQYVLDFLAQVRERSPQALDRVQYIEQPTHRDLAAHPENRMHRAARIKPVVIDESLIDLESLLLCRELGYTGVALKACKGHSGALLMGAAAQKYDMFLCVQDLTCPGLSLLHSASISARMPTIAAIEGNARQYCPAGNRAWAERFPSMFQLTDGTLGTAVLNGPGLGFTGEVKQAGRVPSGRHPSARIGDRDESARVAPRAVVFDLDGLMFNTEELYQEVGGEILRRRGKSFGPELLHAMMGRPPRISLQMMIDWHSLTDTVAQLAEETSEIFAGILDTHLALMPGVSELIASLEAAGIPKAIATSSGRQFTTGVLGRFNLEPRFQFILTSEDIAQGKPHPEIYLLAARRFELSPAEIMVLEDSHHGCQAAIAAGAFAVAVPAGHSRGHDFSGASLVVDTLADPRLYTALGIGRRAY